jgi:MFS family permease
VEATGRVEQGAPPSPIPPPALDETPARVAAEAARAGTLEPLKQRDFALFWSGALVSNVGTWLQNVALSWLVLELTDSAFWVSMVTVAQFLPMLFFGLAGGLNADRRERRRVLVVTQSALMSFAFALAVLTWSGHASVATLLPVVGLSGVVLAFNAPAFQAIIPDLVPPSLVLDAVSLNAAQFSAARVAGPAIGGVLVAAAGAGWAFFTNGASFLAVLAALLAMRTAPHEPPRSSGARALLGGLRAASESPRIRSMLATTAVVSLFGAPVLALLPVMARDVLGRDAGGYGALFAAFSVGAVAGALSTGRLVRRAGMRAVIAGCLGALSALSVAFALSRSVLISSVGLAAIGFAYTTAVSATNSNLQTAVPAHKRGRVMSLYMMAWAGLFPVGALLAGAIATRIGAPATLEITAAPLAAAAVLALRRPRPRPTAERSAP